MTPKLLKPLLAGEYICQYQFPAEWLELQDAEVQEAVGQWLNGLGMRLARVGDEGAFFMAPEFLGPKDITQVKSELLKFRDHYGPAVLLLDFIRQAHGGDTHLSPGEFIVLYRLEEAVAQSSMLETKLKGNLNIIHGASQHYGKRENLRRLMEHLVRGGYVMLSDKDNGTYQVTGKIEQLYQVLQYLDEQGVIPDNEVDDQANSEDDLVDQANAAGANSSDEVTL